MLKKILSFLKKDRISEWLPILERINKLETEFEKLSDEELKLRIFELKEKLNRNEKTLDEILEDVFAIVREASKRTIGLRHYDVQILGGIALHKGMAVEMATGEGKTLVATLPLILNALDGRGVHLVTVNDYLAQRDTVWMGPIYHLLGIKVGCIIHDGSFEYDPTHIGRELKDSTGAFKVFHEFLKPISRKDAYQLDVLYGTNHEFGFDYLRDNLATSPDELVQRELNYAIVDEIDSILIDEARTPLIISSYEKEAEHLYYFFDNLAKSLKKDIHFLIDEKRKTVYLTEEGQNELEKILGFNPYLVENLHAIHHLEEALRANYLFHKDKDYIVKNGQVIIVDEFTGRLMWGRRWSGGLHQAIEAKERVPIQPETKTIAAITIQNFFRKYKKLAGMSGTVMTSAEEFYKVYGLESVAIPTNKPCIRIDHPDKIFLTEKAKWQAVVEKIKELYEIGRPVLVGTTSIEKNELLSKKLKEIGIPHQVLNAKNHEEEGMIIAQAGKLKAVTVATNMAGRGVDIILGGNPQDPEEAKKVKELGGLFVIGTERHEARRIDNQLRGRAGRQGDPGETQFFISLEDDLIKIFGGEKIKKIVEKFKFPENQAIEHPLITKAIEEAQAKVEGFNFDIRKHLLEYDDVINSQREKIYSERRNILLGKVDIQNWLEEEFNKLLEEPREVVNYVFGKNVDNDYRKIFYEKKKWLQEKLEEKLLDVLKLALLRLYDYLWSEHLSYLEEIKESVSYRSYGHRDPLIEFKQEAFESFEKFHRLLRLNFFKYFFALEVKDEVEEKFKKVGRNDPCPCGAKKPDGTPIKYKHCHGK